MLKKAIAVFLSVLTLGTTLCVPVYAEEERTAAEIFATDEAVRYYSKVEVGGNAIRLGGFNSVDGIECKTREDVIAMEESLRRGNYILVTTDKMDITQEEFDLFFNTTFQPMYSVYGDRTYKATELYWEMEMGKLYVYKPSFDDAIEQLRTTGWVSNLTQLEILNSSVVADYTEWYYEERAGTVVYEFNDKIPSWYSTGFLQIESNIDARVCLECMSDRTLYVFYVKANEPFLVKVKAEGMQVRVINEQPLKAGEETLVYNNNIKIREDQHTENTPYILDITKTVAKYDIPPLADVDEKPNYSWENRFEFEEITDFPKEEVIVDTDVEDTEIRPEEDVNRQLIFRIIFIAVIAVCVISFVVWYWIKKKQSETIK